MDQIIDSFPFLNLEKSLSVLSAMQKDHEAMMSHFSEKMRRKTAMNFGTLIKHSATVRSQGCVFEKLVERIDLGFNGNPSLGFINESKIPRKSRYSSSSVESIRFEPLVPSGLDLLSTVSHEELRREPLDSSGLNLLATVALACEELNKRSREEDDDEEEEGDRKRARINVLPLCFENRIRAMGGSEVKLVVEKALTNSDVNNGLSRLSIPESMTLTRFLTEDEEKHLGRYVDNKKKKLDGIDVLVLDPELRESKLKLKKWTMTSYVYNLVRGWNLLVKENMLQAGDRIQIWSFRVDPESFHSGLCFALVKLVGR